MADEDVVRLCRFLLLGSESLYVAGPQEQTSEQEGVPPGCLLRLLSAGNGEKVVRQVMSFQKSTHIRSTPQLLVLAVCARSTCTTTKKAAFEAVGQLCKTPAQLFTFIQYAKSNIESKKGWGRALRRTVSDWYNKKDVMTLARLMTQYKSCSGWKHIDVLRLSHTKPETNDIAVLFKYVLRGLSEAKEMAGDDVQPLMRYLEAVDTVKHSTDVLQVAALVRQHKLHKEHIPTKLLNLSEVWEALIDQMTIPEILINITKIASLGLLDTGAATLQIVTLKILDLRALTSQKVSPMLILIALRAYEYKKGKGKWTNNEDVITSLNQAMSLAITKNVTGSGKRVLVGIKISSKLYRASVRGTLALSPIYAAAGLVQILQRTEASCQLVYFLSDVKPLKVTARMTLEDMCKEMTAVSVGMPRQAQACQCDMTAPIRWAEENRQPYDTIVILTDGKESTGEMTTAQAIVKYRQALKLQTRLVVCGLTASHLDHADPNDLGCLDVAGFDASVPEVISSFAAGNI